MMMQLPELCNTLSKYDGPHADVLKSNFVTDLEVVNIIGLCFCFINVLRCWYLCMRV